MPIQTVTTSWTDGASTIKTIRQLNGVGAGSLDVAIPAGSVNSEAAFSLILSKVMSIFIGADQNVTVSAGGVNAVQQVAQTPTDATGGTFTLTDNGNTTGAILWNATATVVQAALQALPGGMGAYFCSGGPLPTTPIVVTFKGARGVKPITTMTHADALTGGTAPAVVVTSVTTGVIPDTAPITINSNIGLSWDYQGPFPQLFLADAAMLRFTNAGGSNAKVRVRTLSSL